MNDRTTLPTGTVIDAKHRIDGVLGSGALGITYAAFDNHLVTPVAIKEYFPAEIAARAADLTVGPRNAGDHEAFERGRRGFLREAQTLAQFAHRGIVEILNVLAARGTVYMVMRLETGDNLRTWREKLGRAPTQAEVDRILVPLLDALEAMHASNFLHRDIEPGSVIVRPDGSPVLLGFGATRRVAADRSAALTRVVKAGFSPPEQYAEDGRGQGPWSDIYALSGTVYWLLSGDAPPDAAARLSTDMQQPASSMTDAGYRAGFLAALDRASRLDPQERPQSIAEWRAELLRDRAAAPMAEPVATAPSTAAASAGPAPLAASSPRRSQPRIVAAAAAVLVAVGGLMALASLRSATPTDAAVSGAAVPANSSAAAKQTEEGKRIALALPPLGSAPSSSALPPPPGWDLTLVPDIRTALNRVGCHTDATSAAWADADQKALEKFARYTGGVHSFLALNRDIVRVVSTHSDRVCPVQCAAGEISAGDRCVRAPAPDCSQISAINERAQIGLADEAELQLLRSGRCKP